MLKFQVKEEFQNQMPTILERAAASVALDKVLAEEYLLKQTALDLLLEDNEDDIYYIIPGEDDPYLNFDDEPGVTEKVWDCLLCEQTLLDGDFHDAIKDRALARRLGLKIEIQEYRLGDASICEACALTRGIPRA